jgi:hypothetical protein
MRGVGAAATVVLHCFEYFAAGVLILNWKSGSLTV